MKLKKYEEKSLTYIGIFLLIIFVVLIIVFSFQKNIKIYKKITASVIKENLVEVLVTDNELKTIYSNKYLIINRKKQIIKVEQINKNILKRKNKNYHNVILKVKLNSNLKSNDIVTLLLFNKKENVFWMIKTVWKGV